MLNPFFFFRLKSLAVVLVLIGSSHAVLSQDYIDTRIPSDAGGSTGIFLRITPPVRARYGEEGAPVVIHVPGGFNGGGVGPSNAILPLPDCFQIQFNFPGSGAGDQKSGGLYDERGPNCLVALRDVVRFALDEISDLNGNKLSQLVGSIRPLTTNVGLVGFSNGGNVTIATAGIHGGLINGLAWILNWESPVGDGMPNAECGVVEKGSHGYAVNPVVNPAYNPDTGAFDLSTLAYCDTLTVDPNYPLLKGGLYFDINQNGQIDWGIDFVLQPHTVKIGARFVVYYSNRVIQYAREKNILPLPRPLHIADTSETREFWLYRNGENWIAKAVQHNPRLMFIVEASEEDHVQSAPDHPHVLIQYEGFRQAGARFVRLNPDRAYVEAVLGKSAPQAVDNEAFYPFDHLSIRNAVEPAGEDGITNTVGQVAAIYELADRTQFNNITPQLDGVLTPVRDTAPIQPSDFTLEQNFPNPFNATSMIRFQLPVKTHVTLKIFNASGEEVCVLIDKVMEAGEHRLNFDATDLPSGVYLYQLTTASFSKTFKAVLVK